MLQCIKVGGAFGRKMYDSRFFRRDFLWKKIKKDRVIMIVRKESILIFTCFFFAISLSACSFKSEQKVQEDPLQTVKEEQEQKNGFTEEELSAEYLEKDVSDFFQIQGTITPKSVYEDGVGIYRIKVYGTLNGEQRMTVPIERAASAFPNIEPDWEHLDKLRDTVVTLPFQETGSERTGQMVSGEEYFQFLYGSYEDFNPYKHSIIAWNAHVPQKEKKDLSFLGMKEAAEKVKDIIKALTDAEIAEDYTGQSFPEKPDEIIGEYDELSKADRRVGFAGNFYYFLFYFSKDGIKLDDLVYLFPREDGVSYPKTVVIEEEKNMIYLNGERPIQVIYTKDGLIYLDLQEAVEPLELYETVQVLSMEEMAEKLDTYFASQLGMPKTTVTTMELRYDTAVSEPDENGKTVEIIKPYWVVEYYDKRIVSNQSYKYQGGYKAVFDAQTGEFLQYSSIVP